MRGLQILYIFVLRAKKVIIFPRVIQTWYKSCKPHEKAIFSVFYDASPPNFAVLFISRCPVKLLRDLSRQS